MPNSWSSQGVWVTNPPKPEVYKTWPDGSVLSIDLDGKRWFKVPAVWAIENFTPDMEFREYLT